MRFPSPAAMSISTANVYIPVSKLQARVLVCAAVLKDNSWRGIRTIH